MSENLSYYCIKECVIGSPVAKKFLEEAVICKFKFIGGIK